MRAVVYANTDGNLELLNEILEREEDVMLGICVGNLPYIGSGTNVKKFWQRKFWDEGIKAQKYLESKDVIAKYSYSVAGTCDDLFVEQKEKKFRNVMPVVLGGKIMQINTFAIEELHPGISTPVSKDVQVGFLSGYYNSDFYQDRNKDRDIRERKRSSLALCKEDFSIFDRHILDFLFTFESPDTYDNMHGKKLPSGCSQITDLVFRTRPKFHFHAHMRSYDVGQIYETISVSVPALKEGYCILDMHYNTVDIKHVNGNIISNVRNKLQ